MKEYTVRYSIGGYVYESKIWTFSSNAALLWVETIGGANPTVVKEVNE